MITKVGGGWAPGPNRSLRLCSQLLARWPGTHSRILSGIQRAAQTVLGVYLKRTCSRVTSSYSALAVLNDYALYKSTHSLTHSVILTDSSTRNPVHDASRLNPSHRPHSKSSSTCSSGSEKLVTEYSGSKSCGLLGVGHYNRWCIITKISNTDQLKRVLMDRWAPLIKQNPFTDQLSNMIGWWLVIKARDAHFKCVWTNCVC